LNYSITPIKQDGYLKHIMTNEEIKSF